MNNGKALNMTLLTEKYRDILRKQNDITEEDVMSYRTSKLKARLENHFGYRIIFVNKSQKNESQVVFSSDVELEDVINIASEYKQSIADTNFDFGDGNIPHIIENNIKTLHHAAMLQKDDIKRAYGIETSPLNPNDITEESARNILPPNLIKFVSLICEDSEVKLPSKSTKVLSIAQDIVNVASNGRKAMPKKCCFSFSSKNKIKFKGIC